MPTQGQRKPECRFCVQLESSLWGGKKYFRCQMGRFDDKYGRKYFVWRGIWYLNKKVAAAQQDCPCFIVHPQVKQITRKGRP